jgi:hypothetical protein
MCAQDVGNDNFESLFQPPSLDPNHSHFIFTYDGKKNGAACFGRYSEVSVANEGELMLTFTRLSSRQRDQAAR